MAICIPIREKSSKNLISNFIEANRKADIVEIWFDEVKGLNKKTLEQIKSKKRKPILYKSADDMFGIMAIISEKIVDYIDLDNETNSSVIKKIKLINPEIKIIISYHNFKKTPDTKELKKIVSSMWKKGADIAKIATYANDTKDSLRMLSLLSEYTQNGKKMICICMGEKGKLTRTAGHLFGNYLMYAPLKIEKSTAKGQISFDDLKKIQELI